MRFSRRRSQVVPFNFCNSEYLKEKVSQTLRSEIPAGSLGILTRTVEMLGICEEVEWIKYQGHELGLMLVYTLQAPLNTG